MYKSRIALEAQLEVTRLARAQQLAARGDVYDHVYTDVQQQLKQEEDAKKAAAEAEPEETLTETSDDSAEAETPDAGADDAPADDETETSEEDAADAPAEEPNDKAEDAKETPQTEAPKAPDDKAEDAKDAKKDDTDAHAEKSTETAVEAFRIAQESMVYDLIALEEKLTPHLLTGINNGFYREDHIEGLAKLGFKYGGLLLKHVYRGIVTILDTAVKGLYKGGVLFTQTVRNSIQSYERQTKHLDDLSNAVEALGDLPEPSTAETTARYTTSGVIQQLKIEDQVDFTETLKVAIAFGQAYHDNLGKAVKNHLYTTQKLIDSVVEQKLKVHAEKFMREHMTIPGFSTETVEGYEPESDYCTSYVYEAVLPGDVRFIAFLPSNTVQERESVIQAYHESKFFFGVAQQDVEMEESIPYLDRAGMQTMLEQLRTLCTLGLKQRQMGPLVIQQRDLLKKSLIRYIQYLITAQHRVSIEDSLAEFIALRTRSLDKTYLSGALHLHDYQRRVINAGIRYLEASIKAYQDHVPMDDSEVEDDAETAA